MNAQHWNFNYATVKKAHSPNENAKINYVPSALFSAIFHIIYDKKAQQKKKKRMKAVENKKPTIITKHRHDREQMAND